MNSGGAGVTWQIVEPGGKVESELANGPCFQGAICQRVALGLPRRGNRRQAVFRETETVNPRDASTARVVENGCKAQVSD